MIDSVRHRLGRAGGRELRLRLGAEPASVPGARHFVAEGLRSWGREELVDDAALCVSELAGNAALHGHGSFIEVSLTDFDATVRLAVEDDDPTPADVIAARTPLVPDGDELDELLEAPTTGRGLAIVAVLAIDWGVESTEGGKRVWADLPSYGAEAGAAHGAEPGGSARSDVGETAHGLAPSVPVDAPSTTPDLPGGWVRVQLAGCPVELSLRQDQHLDELVRELQLMAAAGGRPESRQLAHRLEAVLRAPAQARLAGRQQATAALERGQRRVDVEMAVPLFAVREVRELDAAVQDADVLCEQERLLTLASPPELRAFRQWMVEEIVGQAEGAPPRRWDDWRADRSA